VTVKQNPIYFSFFMFTADLRPDDREYTKVLVRHIKELQSYGYDGFDVPIAPTAANDKDAHEAEVKSYVGLKHALEDAGLGDVKLSTNVAVTRRFDPSSPYRQQREQALAYLRSRVDITAALGGSLMAGPIIFPYNVFPTNDAGLPLWSDALQAWARPGYEYAREPLQELTEYAAEHGVEIGIEPVDHWETPTPNLVGDVAKFLTGIDGTGMGACVDISHVVLGSEGPEEFRDHIDRLAADDRIHSVHVSAPDRGQLRDSWIPWDIFLPAVLPAYDGNLLVEVFNALPAFVNSFHITRPKFWIPGEDDPTTGVPSAYTVAREAIEKVRQEIRAHQ
jgi:sugar phosphate isomerase/epimerase